MKKLLTLGLFASLATMLFFGISEASVADGAIASGSISVKYRHSNLELRLEGNEFWEKDIDLGSVDLMAGTKTYHIEARNSSMVIIGEPVVPSYYRIDVANYVANSELDDGNIQVLISTNADDLVVEDHIYMGNLAALSSSDFELYPRVSNLPGDAWVSEPITDLYLTIFAYPVSEDTNVEVTYDLVFTRTDM